MRQRSSYKDFLADLLETECAERDERRKQRLVRDANFPLAVGDGRAAKSHLLIGIGTAMDEAGLKVRHTTTVDLVNALAEAPTKRSSPASSPATAALTCSVLTSSAVSTCTRPAPNCCSRSSPYCCSRSSPSGKNGGPSRSSRTLRSRSGSRPSPIPVSARRSWTGSRSTRTSSRPAPSPTVSRRPSGSAVADLHRQLRPASHAGDRPQSFRAPAVKSQCRPQHRPFSSNRRGHREVRGLSRTGSATLHAPVGDALTEVHRGFKTTANTPYPGQRNHPNKVGPNHLATGA